MADEAGNAITLKFMQEAFADWKKDVDRRFDDVIGELRGLRAGQQEQAPLTAELKLRMTETEKDITKLQQLREEDHKAITRRNVVLLGSLAAAALSWLPDLLRAIGG